MAASTTARPYASVPMAEEDTALFDDQKWMTSKLSISVRHAFVRKVYTLTSLQLLVTIGVASFFYASDATQAWLSAHPWVPLVVACPPLLIISWACAYKPQLTRSYPSNLIMLFTLSLSYGVLLGAVVVLVPPKTLWLAIGLTALTVAGLMAFACQTKWDFTGYGPYLAVSSLIMLAVGIISVFWRSSTFHLFYSAVGAALTSFSLVYHTQLILGNDRKRYHLGPDDYMAAALVLYIDIIGIFVYILRILDRGDRQQR